jgi:nucleotide-binding universal stress UspA family protein
MQPVVLAVLGRAEAARACLDAASASASVLGARIVAMVTHVPPETMVFPSEEVLTAARRAELERRTTTAIAALRTTFDRWSHGRGAAAGGAEWVEATGTIEEEVSRHGRPVELLAVAARPSRLDREGAALHAALLGTRRPVLVVPDRIGRPIGRCISVAWHDDLPATQAVLSAMPFLARAETVWVLRGQRAGTPAPEALPAIFVEHRIDAKQRVVATDDGSIGAALFAEARALRSDLMVMGAFGHHPLLEAVFGGVTRTMLHDADFPLLMRH